MREKNSKRDNNKFEFGAIGRKDSNGNDYYVAVVKQPLSLDLSGGVVFHFFPWENDTDKFGMDVTFREYDPNYKQDKQEHITHDSIALHVGGNGNVNHTGNGRRGMAK